MTLARDGFLYLVEHAVRDTKKTGLMAHPKSLLPRWQISSLYTLHSLSFFSESSLFISSFPSLFQLGRLQELKGPFQESLASFSGTHVSTHNGNTAIIPPQKRHFQFVMFQLHSSNLIYNENWKYEPSFKCYLDKTWWIYIYFIVLM